MKSLRILGWRRIIATFSFCLFFAGVGSPVFGDNVTLAWDPSADPMVAGYNLYSGVASRTYTNLVDTKAATSTVLSNLTPGVTYFFAATTYTLAGLESDYSSDEFKEGAEDVFDSIKSGIKAAKKKISDIYD